MVCQLKNVHPDVSKYQEKHGVEAGFCKWQKAILHHVHLPPRHYRRVLWSSCWVDTQLR